MKLAEGQVPPEDERFRRYVAALVLFCFAREAYSFPRRKEIFVLLILPSPRGGKWSHVRRSRTLPLTQCLY